MKLDTNVELQQYFISFCAIAKMESILKQNLMKFDKQVYVWGLSQNNKTLLCGPRYRVHYKANFV